jgi:hypothetical protein
MSYFLGYLYDTKQKVWFSGIDRTVKKNIEYIPTWSRQEVARSLLMFVPTENPGFFMIRPDPKNVMYRNLVLGTEKQDEIVSNLLFLEPVNELNANQMFYVSLDSPFVFSNMNDECIISERDVTTTVSNHALKYVAIDQSNQKNISRSVCSNWKVIRI